MKKPEVTEEQKVVVRKRQELARVLARLQDRSTSWHGARASKAHRHVGAENYRIGAGTIQRTVKCGKR